MPGRTADTDASGRRRTRWWLAFGAAVLVALVALWGRSPAPAPAPPPERRAAPSPVPTLPSAAPVAERPSSGVSVRVECELSERVDAYSDIVIEELDPDSFDFVARHLPTASGTWIQFTPKNAVGVGIIHTRHHKSRPLGWVDGACIDLVELERLPTRTVRGRVSGQIEVGGVAVHARCDGDRDGFSGSLAAGGRFEVQLPVDQDCALEVRRVFADTELVSEPVRVAAGEDDLEGIELSGPVAPGAGVGLFPVDGGLRVRDLERGGSAEQAGLQLLDLVLAIDGVPARDLDPETLQSLDGPARLEVERDGEILEIALRAPQ